MFAKQQRDSKPKGSSPELMPSIMGAIDALLETTHYNNNNNNNINKSFPKRTYQSSNFANLSPNVQKILSNVPEQELSKHFNSEEFISTTRRMRPQYSSMRSLKSPERRTKDVEIISQGVQKMLSNLPDSELIVSKVAKNGVHEEDVVVEEVDANEGLRPLGNYLQTSASGIASRSPAGRLNAGKFLQVTSESSMCTTNSTASSEVSRPVSLTSLGSCSSSSSGGGHHQVSSAYIASAESLDSDVEHNATGSQGSADSGIADQQTSTPEMRVLQEVMDTETDYVADLKEVIEGYLEPWRSDPKCPLQNYLGHLFNNLEEVYNFNRSFLDQLRLANYDPTEIANVFLRNDSGFSVYTEYCTGYPRTMDVLVELTRNDLITPLFREKQSQLRHALPLGSYLLKPVQRILKYHLLLQRLSKQCEPQHKPTVDLALATMTGIASHINTMKRKHEHAVRVQEIQSQLYGWTGDDLTALGELIAEGTFRVGGARGRRHVFLFDKLLLMAKPRQDGALAYKNHIMCSNLMLVEQVRGEPLSFHVLPFDNPRLQCTLRARSVQHKREWTMQIKRVILENYSAVIPNHARQLVMQLGQDVHTDDSGEKWTPIKQHSVPEYLERRSRVRKSNCETRRATSQDRLFVPLGNWRRKSEPMMVPQYNTKIVPKKITKLKKAKDRSAKFYMDLSDSDNCDAIGESCETLESKNGNETEVENTLEKVVSDLLMQNKEFQKFKNRKKKQRTSEPLPELLVKPELPAKADSLPRNLQLSSEIDGAIFGAKSKESIDEEQEITSSDLTGSDHPEHKIYRKSTIRFSLLQRFRAIITEEQKPSSPCVQHKQGSSSMGEKLANPDYADPCKLFSSRSNLNEDVDLLSEPERLDMSIGEQEMLMEFESRLKVTSSQLQVGNSSSQGFAGGGGGSSYYETVLESSFKEDETSSNLDRPNQNGDKRIGDNNSTKVKRPTVAPPPVPHKPKELSNLCGNRGRIFERRVAPVKEERTGVFGGVHGIDRCQNNNSWVKAMVGRFE